jgi:hypothetical protein
VRKVCICVLQFQSLSQLFCVILLRTLSVITTPDDDYFKVAGLPLMISDSAVTTSNVYQTCLNGITNKVLTE